MFLLSTSEKNTHSRDNLHVTQKCRQPSDVGVVNALLLLFSKNYRAEYTEASQLETDPPQARGQSPVVSSCETRRVTTLRA